MFWNNDKLTVDPVYKLILKLACTSKQNRQKLFCCAAECSPTDSNDSLEAKLNYFLTD